MDPNLNPASPPPLKPNPASNTLIVLLVVLSFILLGTTGYLAFQNYQLKKIIGGPSTSPFPTSVPTSIPISVPLTDPKLTADWKTYTSISSNFSFKYPSDMILEDRDGNIYLTKWGPTQKPETEYYDALLLIFSKGQLTNLTLENYAKQQIENTRKESVSTIIEELTQITINNQKAYTFTSQGLGIFKSMFIASPDGKIVLKIVDGTSDPSGQGFKNLSNQILSTFKFTN